MQLPMMTLSVIHKESDIRACITAKVPPCEMLLSVQVRQCQRLVPALPPGSQVAPMPCKLPLKCARVYGAISSTEGAETVHFHR